MRSVLRETTAEGGCRQRSTSTVCRALSDTASWRHKMFIERHLGGLEEQNGTIERRQAVDVNGGC